MKKPLYTSVGAKKARRRLRGVAAATKEKVLLRRKARRGEKTAVRRGNFDEIHRGQDERDVI